MLNTSNLSYIIQEASKTKSKSGALLLSQEDENNLKLALSTNGIAPDSVKPEYLIPINSYNTDNTEETFNKIANYMGSAKVQKALVSIDTPLSMLFGMIATGADKESVVLLNKLGILEPLIDMFRVKPNVLKPGEKKFITIDPARAASINAYVITSLAVAVMKTLITLFINLQIVKFGMARIKRTMENKNFYDFFKLNVDHVYETKGYKKLSLAEYRKSSLLDQVLARWKDPDPKKVIKNVGDEVFETVYTTSCALFLPFRGFLLSIPAKFLLGYMGLRLQGTSIYTMMMDIEGSTVQLSLSFTPAGFVITTPRLFARKSNGSIVRVDLPEPPRNLYQLPPNSYLSIMKAIKKDPRKEIKRTKLQIQALSDAF